MRGKNIKSNKFSKIISFMVAIVLMMPMAIACDGLDNQTGGATSEAIILQESESESKMAEADSEGAEADSQENKADLEVTEADSGLKGEESQKSESQKEDTKSGILEVHYIDVGQGDSTLIICDGEAMLIDAGNNNMGTLVQNYIRKRGVTELKYIIGTHPDADHIGGLDVIITKYNITSNQVWMPDVDNDTATYRDLVGAIEYRNYKRICPKAGKTYALGKAIVKILGPVRKAKDSNDNSIVVSVQNGNNTFIFSGDAGEEEEYDIASSYDISGDVLKVGHHGSKGSSSEYYLSSVSPKAAVISVGKNTYGHPTAQCLNRLRNAGIKLYRTDDQGSIVATSDGDNIVWNCSPTDNWKSGEKSKEPHQDKTQNDKKKGTASKNPVVYITKTGKKYHLAGCRYLKTCIETTLKAAKAKGLKPCSVCGPPQ